MNKFFVGISISIALVIITKDTLGERIKSCPHGFYRNTEVGPQSPWQKQCLLCTTCPSGQGVKRSCSTEADSVCETCVPGKSHVAGWGKRKYCRKCKTCGKNRQTLKTCTLHEDTQCGECKKGCYWNPILDACEPCSWCFPDLYEPSERFVTRQCMIPEIPVDYQCAVLAIPQDQPTWQSTFSEHKTDENESIESSGGSGDEVEQGSGSYETKFVSDDEDFFPHKAHKPQEQTTEASTVKPVSTLDHTSSKTEIDVTMTQEQAGGSEQTKTNYNTNCGTHDAIEINTLASKQAAQSSDNVLLIALAVTGAVCAFLVVALVIVSRKYVQLRRTYVKGSVTGLSEVSMDETLLGDVKGLE